MGRNNRIECENSRADIASYLICCIFTLNRDLIVSNKTALRIDHPDAMRKLSQMSSPHLHMGLWMLLTKSSPFYWESLQNTGYITQQRPCETFESLPNHTAHHISEGMSEEIFFYHICGGTQALMGWVHVKLRCTGLMYWSQTLKNTSTAGRFGSMTSEGVWKRRATTVPCCSPPTRCASSAWNPDAQRQQHKTISSSLTKQSTTKISSHSNILKVTLPIRALPWISWLLNPLKTNYQPLHAPMPIRTLKRTSSDICPSVMISIQFLHPLLLYMTVKESYFILDMNCPRSLLIFFFTFFHIK